MHVLGEEMVNGWVGESERKLACVSDGEMALWTELQTERSSAPQSVVERAHRWGDQSDAKSVCALDVVLEEMLDEGLVIEMASMWELVKGRVWWGPWWGFEWERGKA